MLLTDRCSNGEKNAVSKRNIGDRNALFHSPRRDIDHPVRQSRGTDLLKKIQIDFIIFDRTELFGNLPERLQFSPLCSLAVIKMNTYDFMSLAPGYRRTDGTVHPSGYDTNGYL